jgi:hypothetical protein
VDDLFSELAELCWNLESLHRLEAEATHACRLTHARQMTMGGPTVAHRVHCGSKLGVMGIRKKTEHHCRRRHVRGC